LQPKGTACSSGSAVEPSRPHTVTQRMCPVVAEVGRTMVRVYELWYDTGPSEKGHWAVSSHAFEIVDSLMHWWGFSGIFGLGSGAAHVLPIASVGVVGVRRPTSITAIVVKPRGLGQREWSTAGSVQLYPVLCLGPPRADGRGGAVVVIVVIEVTRVHGERGVHLCVGWALFAQFMVHHSSGGTGPGFPGLVDNGTARPRQIRPAGFLFQGTPRDWWRIDPSPHRFREVPGQVIQCGSARPHLRAERGGRGHGWWPRSGSSQVGSSSLFGSRGAWWATETPFFSGRHFDPTKGFPGEGPLRSDIRVVTLNANANRSALRFIKDHGAEVDIFFLQEIKVAYEPKKSVRECPVEGFRDKLLKLGFKSAVAAGKVTDKNGRSGGVAIAWRGHLNVTSPSVVYPHRAVSVDLHTHGVGDINLVCVYGDVLGTWAAQADLWRSVSKAAARSGKPFVWGGDWNASVPEVREILGSMNIPGTIAAPLRSTCVTPLRGVNH
jgi:hypothetical protein